jgi:hypothetical protein
MPDLPDGIYYQVTVLSPAGGSASLFVYSEPGSRPLAAKHWQFMELQSSMPPPPPASRGRPWTFSEQLRWTQMAALTACADCPDPEVIGEALATAYGGVKVRAHPLGPGCAWEADRVPS